MNKGLEALKEYRNQQQGVCVYADDYLDIIEKEIKTLEIIKRFSYYNIHFLDYLLSENKITQEEYDLLKEVLL